MPPPRGHQMPTITEIRTTEIYNNGDEEDHMGDLSGFSDRKQERRQGSGTISRPAPAAPAPRQPQSSGPRVPDRNRCPNGWDADVWHLVLRFEQYADADGITLRAGRPVIYAEINELVTRWNMREKSTHRTYRQQVRGCARRELSEDRADHCWYHWPPHAPARQTERNLTWVEMVEIIMAEFWSRIWDDHALDQFRAHFAEYGMQCATHWKSLRIMQAIANQPRDHIRPIVRRKSPSGTIAGDSKEG